jgi:predicted transcriptional regulator
VLEGFFNAAGFQVRTYAGFGDAFGYLRREKFTVAVIDLSLQETNITWEEVLDLLRQGLTNQEIADKLYITTNTVKRHLKAVFEKLGLHTRTAATAKAADGRPFYIYQNVQYKTAEKSK